MNVIAATRRAVPAILLLTSALGATWAADIVEPPATDPPAAKGAPAKDPPAVKIVADAPADWAKRTIVGQDVSYRAPAGWKEAEDKRGTTCMLEVDAKGTNVNFVVQPRGPGMDIDDAPKAVSGALKAQLPSYKEVLAEVVEVAGERAARIVYEMEFNGVKMKGSQYVLLSAKTACFVTYTSAADHHAAHAAEAEQVAASVKLP